jgi:hypothetical protein
MVAKCGSSFVNTSTKLNVNNMDTREICKDKVLLNRSRAGTRWTSMTKLDDEALLL